MEVKTKTGCSKQHLQRLQQRAPRCRKAPSKADQLCRRAIAAEPAPYGFVRNLWAHNSLQTERVDNTARRVIQTYHERVIELKRRPMRG